MITRKPWLRTDFLEKRIEFYDNMIILRERVREVFKDQIFGPDKIDKMLKHHLIYHLSVKMNIKIVVIAHIMGCSQELITMTVQKMRKDKNRMQAMEEEIEERLQGHLVKHRRKFEFRIKY
jgi:hypothetical protein